MHDEIGNTFANMAQEGNEELEDELNDLIEADREAEVAAQMMDMPEPGAATIKPANPAPNKQPVAQADADADEEAELAAMMNM